MEYATRDRWRMALSLLFTAAVLGSALGLAFFSLSGATGISLLNAHIGSIAGKALVGAGG
jgi:hypothetical protein